MLPEPQEETPEKKDHLQLFLGLMFAISILHFSVAAQYDSLFAGEPPWDYAVCGLAIAIGFIVSTHRVLRAAGGRYGWLWGLFVFIPCGFVVTCLVVRSKLMKKGMWDPGIIDFQYFPDGKLSKKQKFAKNILPTLSLVATIGVLLYLAMWRL